MKKAWFLVLQYILFLFVGSLLGVFIYTQYYSNINLVAGIPVAFSKYPLVKGLFVFLPIVLLIMGMYLSLYKVRHFSNPISCAIFYSCLGLLTWLVFLPLTLKCINYVNPMVEKIAEAEPENILSRGYFRRVGNVYYYFLEEQKGDIIQVISIDSKPDSFGSIKQLDVSSDSEFSKSTYPFADPIINNSLHNIPYRIMKIFANVEENLFNALHKGIFSWLLICSFGFALWSVYGLIRVSSWKLINTFMIIFMQGFIILFNGIYYSERFELLHSLIPSNNLFSGSELLLAIINFVVGIVLITIGIISTCLRKREY